MAAWFYAAAFLMTSLHLLVAGVSPVAGRGLRIGQ